MKTASENSDTPPADEVLRRLGGFRRRARGAAAVEAALQGTAGGLSVAAWLLALTALPPPLRWILWALGAAAAMGLCLHAPRLRDTSLWAWLPMGTAAVGAAVVLASSLSPGGLSDAARLGISLALVAVTTIASAARALLRRRPLRQVALLLDRLGESGEQWLTAAELADPASAAPAATAVGGVFDALQRRRLLSWHERRGKRVRFALAGRSTIGVLIVSACAAALLALVPAHLTAAQAERARSDRAKADAGAVFGKIEAGGGGLLSTQALVKSILAWRSAPQESDPSGRRITRRELAERLDDHLRALQGLQRAGRAVAEVLRDYDATRDLAILLGDARWLDEARRWIERVAGRIQARTQSPAERARWLEALRKAAASAESCIPLWRALTAAADALDAGDAAEFRRQMDRIVTALARARSEIADTEKAITALSQIGRPAPRAETEPTTTRGSQQNGNGAGQDGGPNGGATSRPAAEPQRVFAGTRHSASRSAMSEPAPAAGDATFVPLEEAIRQGAPEDGWLARLDPVTRRMVQRYFAGGGAAATEAAP